VRISLQPEESGIGPSYSEAPLHLHTSTSTPQHQCWPSRKISGDPLEKRGRDFHIGPSQMMPRRANSITDSGAVLLFLLPFGYTIGNLKVIHTVRRKIVKRKTCRWTRKWAIRDFFSERPRRKSFDNSRELTAPVGQSQTATRSANCWHRVPGAVSSRLLSHARNVCRNATKDVISASRLEYLIRIADSCLAEL